MNWIVEHLPLLAKAALTLVWFMLVEQDIVSTKDFLKKGTADEGGLLMAPLQKLFPKGWVYWKVALSAMIGLPIILFMPGFYAVAALIFLNIIYYGVIQENYATTQR